jgi:transposase
MLVNWHEPDHVYLVCGKTDLRKGIDGLAMVIAEHYGLELYDNSLFLFCGTRSDRFKGLFWDGEGFILLYKRFENGRLTWPRHSREAKELTTQQLDYLLAGLNPFPARNIKKAIPGDFY